MMGVNVMIWAMVFIVEDIREIIVLLDMNFRLSNSLPLLPNLLLEWGKELFSCLIAFCTFLRLFILSASWMGLSLIGLFFFLDNNNFKVLLFWQEFLNKGKFKVEVGCFIILKFGLVVSNDLYLFLIHFMEHIIAM